LARGFSCYQGDKRSECGYSRVFSTMITAKRSTKKFPKCFLFDIVKKGISTESATSLERGAKYRVEWLKID